MLKKQFFGITYLSLCTAKNTKAVTESNFGAEPLTIFSKILETMDT